MMDLMTLYVFTELHPGLVLISARSSCCCRLSILYTAEMIQTTRWRLHTNNYAIFINILISTLHIRYPERFEGGKHLCKTAFCFHKLVVTFDVCSPYLTLQTQYSFEFCSWFAWLIWAMFISTSFSIFIFTYLCSPGYITDTTRGCV